MIWYQDSTRLSTHWSLIVSLIKVLRAFSCIERRMKSTVCNLIVLNSLCRPQFSIGKAVYFHSPHGYELSAGQLLLHRLPSTLVSTTLQILELHYQHTEAYLKRMLATIFVAMYACIRMYTYEKILKYSGS